MIKEFRIKYNLTQKQLSAMMKVSRSILSNWENGTRNPCFKSKAKIVLFFIKFYLGLTFKK